MVSRHKIHLNVLKAKAEKGEHNVENIAKEGSRVKTGTGTIV